MLDNEASYLGRLGETVTDVSQLWSFAVMQADGLSPTPSGWRHRPRRGGPGAVVAGFQPGLPGADQRRDTLGPLGYGWTRRLAVFAVRGLRRHRHRDHALGRPSASSSPTAAAATTSTSPATTASSPKGPGGTFTLQETDGQIEAFNANGTLDYIQDTNGNRITAGYTGGRSPASPSTSGASLTIAYNAAGLIASVTSSDGRTVNYTYDAGEHLTSVQSYDGTVTQFTYDSGSNPATVNALTSIQFPDGTSADFTYDAVGRLAGHVPDRRRRSRDLHLQRRRGDRHRRRRRCQPVLLRSERPDRQDRRPAGQRLVRHLRRAIQPRPASPGPPA